jgi:hypothetical protein
MEQPTAASSVAELLRLRETLQAQLAAVTATLAAVELGQRLEREASEGAVE